MNESTIVIAAFLALMTFFVPRKYFLVPFIVTFCFVPVDQRIIILTLDFPVIRILVLIGVLRILLRGEQRLIKWNTFDRLLLAWGLCDAVVYVIQWSDMRALIYKSGGLFDLVGLYWLFRQTIDSWKNMRLMIKILSICVLILVPLIAFEWSTGRNLFAILGTIITEERAGRFRCQGAFSHSIMFGLFAATVVPLFIGMAMLDKNKALYWVAAAASIFLVMASASSCPILVLLFILLIMCAFKWRKYTGLAWKGFFASLIILHIVMKAPVWHLIARVNIVGASTGWYRFHLINQTIERFSEWALIGIRSTRHWVVPGYRALTDITNQYVAIGLSGGIVTLALFIALLVLAFRILAKCYQQTRSPAQLWLGWSVFAAMLGHCMAFFGVSYFGQIGLLWFLMLGMVGFVAEENEKATGETVNLSLRSYKLPVISELPVTLKHKQVNTHGQNANIQ